MKIGTEEIFVLTKAKVGGTKNWRKQSKPLSIRRSGSTRSRKETNRGNRGSMLWLGGGEETPPLFGPQQQYQMHSQQNDQCKQQDCERVIQIHSEVDNSESCSEGSRTYSRSSRLRVRDVTNVKPSGEWLNMESKNLSHSLKVNESD